MLHLFRPPATGNRGAPAQISVAAFMRGHHPLKVAAAFLLIAGGSATALGESAIMAGVAAAQAQIDAISGRSPGIRTEANMIKGKPRIAPARVARALPRVRDARGSTFAPAAVLPPTLAGLIPGAVAAPAAIGPAFGSAPADVGPGSIIVGPAAGPGGGGGFFGSPLGGGGFGGGGFGGGGGGGVIFVPPGETTPETPVVVTPPGETTPETPVIVTPPGETPGTPPVIVPPIDVPGVPGLPTTPVPEPQSWLMMILGFGFAGAALRQRRSNTRQPACLAS